MLPLKKLKGEKIMIIKTTKTTVAITIEGESLFHDNEADAVREVANLIEEGLWTSSGKVLDENGDVDVEFKYEARSETDENLVSGA